MQRLDTTDLNFCRLVNRDISAETFRYFFQCLHVDTLQPSRFDKSQQLSRLPHIGPRIRKLILIIREEEEDKDGNNQAGTLQAETEDRPVSL
jgi:hypothetical protein